jgi:hypothetical protein
VQFRPNCTTLDRYRLIRPVDERGVHPVAACDRVLPKAAVALVVAVAAVERVVLGCAEDVVGAAAAGDRVVLGRQPGGMFWLRRSTLPGSYRRLSA